MKLFLVASLFVAQTSFADAFFINENITIRAGTSGQHISLEEKSECLMNYEALNADRVFTSESVLNVTSTSQSEYKPTLRTHGKEIIESIGGTYDASKMTSDLAIANEIEKLGGGVNYINGKILSRYKHETKINLQSLDYSLNGSSFNAVVSCRTVEQVSTDDVLNLFAEKSGLTLRKGVVDRQF